MENGAENDNLMFIAGQSEYNEQTREQPTAIIGCLSMAYHLTPVTQYKLRNTNYGGATSIKRIRASTNEFIVGVMKGLVVVYFDHNTFREITSFDNLHTGRYPLKKK